MSLTPNITVKMIEEEAARRKPSKTVGSIIRLTPFLFRYKSMLVAAFVALIVATLSTLAFPIAGGRLVELLKYGSNQATSHCIDQYFFSLIAIALMLGLASAARFYFVSWIGERVVADLRESVYTHVLTLSPAFFEATRTGEILSRLTADTTLIKTVVGASAAIALRNLFLFAGAAFMMLYTSLHLSGLVLLAILVIVLPLVIFGRWVRRLSCASQDRLADISAFGAESLNAIQTMQAFTHEDIDRKHFNDTVELSFNAAKARIIARAILTALIFFFSLSSIVGVLWFGMKDVIASEMTSGLLAQFILYALFLAGSLAALSEVWGDLQMAAGATERLMELISIEPDIRAPITPLVLPMPLHGSICFECVTFSYPMRPNILALHEYSFSVEPGEMVAIVGPSGASKSTVFQLLLRFYNPQAGRIMLDGIDISKVDPIDVRRRLAVVLQETVIFGTTIAENIRYGRPDANEIAVQKAATAAHIHDFITSLPDGYNTEVSERGVTLSGGQRQRIAIARAILRDASVLLLDEATSALDAESEMLVQSALEGLMKGCTTLVIAHRLATVLKANRIFVMEEGRIVASGTHDELIYQGGLYRRLARLQFTDNLICRETDRNFLDKNRD